MTEASHHFPGDRIGEKSPPPVLRWTVHGIDPVWVDLHLRPACESFGDALEYVPVPDEPVGLEAPGQTWSILFVGDERGDPEGTHLEDQVQALLRRYPLACIVVMMPSSSLGRQVSLMRAGALEVLALTVHDRRLEQALQRAIATVHLRLRLLDDEKRRVVNQLAVSVNHEINNPLTGLMGTAELLLLENKKLDEKTRRDLKLILAQCRRIQEVTTCLKNLNHIRTVPYGTHDQMIDLVGEIGAATQEEPQEEIVTVPEASVRDANAVAPEPAAAIESVPEAVEAARKETGPAELLEETADEPQSDEEAAAPAIARKTDEPARKPEKPAPEPPVSVPTRSEQFLPTPTLLIVDDNPLIIDLIMRLFDQTFRVDGATSVTDALGKVEQHAYDLVLIDLIMPEMNGLEMFRAIRKLRPEQKALLTTAYQGDTRVEQAIVEGAIGCVYKPFEIEDLEKVLTDALHGAGAHGG
jgi:CheY-like chemotaxis protein